VEGGVRNTLVLWGLMDVKLALTSVDPPYRVTSAVESQEFEPLDVSSDEALPSISGEHDLFLLHFPYAGASFHGGSET
jgi:hypothetical protein